MKAYQSLLNQTSGFSHEYDKTRMWEWLEKCQDAFEGFQTTIMEEPVLALLDHAKHFKAQIDAPDVAVGGVLI